MEKEELITEKEELSNKLNQTQEKMTVLIKSLHSKGMSDEEIASIANMSLDEIRDYSNTQRA